MHTRYVMGTFLTVQVEGVDKEACRHADNLIFDEIQHLDELLSIYRPGSEVSQINKAAGHAPVPVSQKTYSIIAEALRYADLTSGAFDPTVQDSFHQSLNYRHVILNPSEQTVFLTKQGMRLDLGGIGKGYALDCALDRVSAIPSLTKIFIDFGGQLLFWAPEGSFEPVSVAIEDPGNRNTVLTTLRIGSNGSVSTSSNAEHRGHLLNPRTGQPASGMASVTVMAPTGTQAEALSTALFILKPEEAPALLKKCPEAKATIFPSSVVSDIEPCYT
jgi:thiamine biosynthesis lipoprotein